MTPVSDTAGAVQDARRAPLDGCRVPGRVDAIPGRFDAIEGDALVVEECIEHADGIRSAADAREDGIGKPSDLIQKLSARFFADDLLEVTDHGRERVRARGGAEDVVRVLRNAASMFAIEDSKPNKKAKKDKKGTDQKEKTDLDEALDAAENLFK